MIGAAMAVLINVWETFSYYVVHSSWMRFGYVSLAVMLPFILLAFPINGFLRWLRPSWALQPWELMVIFSMAMVAAIFPTLGIMGFLLSFTTSPTYYASPENQWNEYLVRHMPKWLTPSNKANAITWLYQGVPAGQPIPWDAWVVPLFWWSSLIAAVFVTCFCTMVILRRQWVDHERLAFPLARLPLVLMEENGGPGAMPAFARSKIFWIGMAIPLFIIGWNIITYFYPEFPQIPIYKWRWIRLARSFPPVLVKVNFFVMCFAYFTPLNILLSVWLFQLLVIIEVGVFQRIGFTIGSPDNWCTFNAATGWQCFGGFLFLVASGFWMMRRHLKGVLARVLGVPGGVDDSSELLSYRTAAIGAALGALFVLFWFWRAGLSTRVALFFVPMAFITYVGVTRLVAQTGLVYLWGPITPQSATFHILGSSSMTPVDVNVIGLSYCIGCNVERLVPSTAAHVIYLNNRFRFGRKSFVAAMAIAAVLSMATAAWFTLYLAYTRGASNFNSFEFSRGPFWIFGILIDKIKNPQPTDTWRLLFLGIGAGLMFLATLLNYRLPWWPIHPVGLALAGTHPTRMVAFTIFLTWMIKLIVVKVGGSGLYRKSIYFFVGMLVGYVLGVGASFVVDCIWFMGRGHVIHLW